jgi:Site-specific recombinase XerD
MAFKKKHRDGKTGKLIPYGKYIFKFVDHLGISRCMVGFKDLKATNDLQRNVSRLMDTLQSGGVPDSSLQRFIEKCEPKKLMQLAEWGIIDRARIAGSRPLIEHAKVWKAHLEACQYSPRHCAQSLSRISRLINECRLNFSSDVTAEIIENWLKQQRQLGMSIRTSNCYLATVKACFRWLVDSGVISASPLSRLKKLNEATDIRLVRRALSDDELKKLLRTTFYSSKKLYGMTGPERSMIYLFAVRTGVRWGEMKCMTRSDFSLNSNPATVKVRASIAKNGMPAVLPLVPGVTQTMADYFKATPALPGAAAFPMPKSDKGGVIIGKDLKAAGIAIVDENGQKVDFHSLRHTFITSLARTNIHLKVVQELARHSEINLTMRHYTHVLLDEKTAALGRLPEATDNAPDEYHDDTESAVGT